MLRTLFRLPLLLALTVALGLAGVAAGLLDRSGRLSQRLARRWGRWVLAAVGVRSAISGLEHAPRGPAVYAANHASVLDIPLLFASLPVDFRVIHKRSLYLLPLVGWFLFLAGHIGIDRGHAFRARRSLERAAARIRGGTSVAVFPEGTRSRDALVRRFKRGSFVLARRAGVPVVPVSLAGVKQVMPRGILSLRPGLVHVRLHPPQVEAPDADAPVDWLAERVRQAVVDGLEA